MRNKIRLTVSLMLLVSIAITAAAEISGGKSGAGILDHLKGLLRFSNKRYKSHLSRVSSEQKDAANLTETKRQDIAEKATSKQEEFVYQENLETKDCGCDATEPIIAPVIEEVVDVGNNCTCDKPSSPLGHHAGVIPVIVDPIVDNSINPLIAIAKTVESEIISRVAASSSHPSGSPSVSYPTTIPPWAAVAFFGAAAAIAIALGVSVPAEIELVAAPIDSMVMGRFSCRQTHEVKIPFYGSGNSSAKFDDGYRGPLLKKGPCASPYYWVTVDPTTFKVNK